MSLSWYITISNLINVFLYSYDHYLMLSCVWRLNAITEEQHGLYRGGNRQCDVSLFILCSQQKAVQILCQDPK